ncbi:MAG: beta-ketoacyl-ACP synthase [Myxococcota bacterium]
MSKAQRRVAITGIGLCSPIGHSLDEAADALQHERHGIVYKPEWEAIGHMQTRLAAEVRGLDLDKAYPRRISRTMGRVGLLSAYASDRAIEDAGLEAQELTDPRTGVAYGSTHGSSSALEQWCRQVFSNHGFKGVASTSYIKFMSHTCAANLALKYSVRGRIITTCSACVSGSQAIGSGYEAIQHGAADVMVCGGAEEMHFSHAGVFDIMFATSSRHNDDPGFGPRPFDAERDGLVVGEGAGTLVLEDWDRAVARGATIHAEVVGYGTNCDGSHITAPSTEGMAAAMRLALEDAELDAGAIGYVNAHATATEVGDIAESRATHEVLGARVPVSSTKSFTGHTLGACGAIEAAFCIRMMRDGWIAPNRTLHRVDPRCAELNYVGREPQQARPEIVMSNNFAFGGINTSLILRGV